MGSASKMEPVVSIRLVSADYYMSSPICGLDIGYSSYRGMEVRKLPVIRVFGSTSSGHKVCLHIHGVLPYLYIPYDGSTAADRMGHQLSMALDKAINVLQGQSLSNSHHVFKTTLVNGIPLYGYHRKEHQFFKMFFYNPNTRKHSYDLFLNGAIMNKVFQPCEAHIPYVLQFMIDFNLQGMNYIRLKSALARRLPDGIDNLSASKAEPVSTCEMELDCSADDILNCLDIQDGIKMNPGLASLWEEEINRRRVKNMNLDNLSPPASQIRLNVVPTSSHLYYLNIMKQKFKENAVTNPENLSLSISEVNELLETSLAIETPDDVRDQLSASSIDFHGAVQRKTSMSSELEGDPELLDILCELADDHDSTLEYSPQLSITSGTSSSIEKQDTELVVNEETHEEESAIDEDSILGTQCSKTSQTCALTQVESNQYSGESDEDDRETLEMTQIFENEEFPELTTDVTTKRIDQQNVPAANDLIDIGEQEDEDDDDSNATLTQDFLPNLDGANDTSSDDEEQTRESKPKKIRKYKPLVFRKITTKKNPNQDQSSVLARKEISTIAGPSSSAMSDPSLLSDGNDSVAKVSVTPNSDNLKKNHPSTRKGQERQFSDALFAMSMLSPQSDAPRDSPPRPDTPNRIDSAQVVIRPLLEDIATFNHSRKGKVKVNSGTVVLKSLRDEVQVYQTKFGRKLHLPADLKSDEQELSRPAHFKGKRKRSETADKKTAKKKQMPRADRLETHDVGEKEEIVQVTEKKIDPNEIDLEKVGEGILPKRIDSNQAEISILEFDSNQAEISILELDDTERNEKDCSETKQTEETQTNAIDRAEQEIEGDEIDEKDILSLKSHTQGSTGTLQDNPLAPSSSLTRNSQLSSDPASYDSFKTWNMVTEDNDSVSPDESSLPFDNIQPFLPDSTTSEVLSSSLFKAGKTYTPVTSAPTRDQVMSTMEQHGIALYSNLPPFWGDAKDEVKLKNIRGKSLTIDSKLVRSLPEFKSIFYKMNVDELVGQNFPVILTPLDRAPSKESVSKWLESRSVSKATMEETPSQKKCKKKQDNVQQNVQHRSQLEAPSMNNSYGFRVSFGNCLEAKSVHQHQYLTVMSMELHVSSRQQLHPDPEFDAIEAVFFTLTNDVPVDSSIPQTLTAVIVVRDASSDESAEGNFFSRTGVVNVEITVVENEVALFREVFKLIRLWDPDILLGFEIEMLSWGFLLERGTLLGLAMNNLLSRVPSVVERTYNTEDVIEGGYMVEKNSDIAILGRIVLNLWRLLRVEIAVQSYTFENMVFHILHRRVQNFTFEKLTLWWKSNHDRWQVIEHYITRVRGNIQLLEQLDMIGRTSELARLFGIQFYEVFTRGSQFRVESMMLRLAKPNNFVAVSPSVIQRSRMKAPEWLPLILEPESKFYTDPVLVLDFQSLYPSMIIAYNYCYSTCLGRAHHLGRNEPFEFGCTQLLIPPDIVEELVEKDLVNISPAGAVFAKPEVRTGILPQMLSEILNTRIMVKQSMKEYKGDNTLRRVFESRQMGLKLIANVTYGYTSANFSGRMPCVELGDSVVSKGRETLERTIHMIEERSEWNAKVVYGDTDSVFVLLPGRSKQEAFAIGAEIADAVTQTNPPPVKLKFEKVYQPCILQTKKRYVGFKYETIDQKDPVYEAKGIETVRRDGCPAVVKILERSLRVLFETKDVSKVKAYVQRQFSKILQNRISIQDFIFAKEFRGRQGYRPGACVPALEIAKNQLKNDRRSEARIGERVPYIIVYGSPGVPLIRLVIPAQQLLHDTSLRLNVHYYISRAITPPLQRCLGLLGVDVPSWYQSVPRISAGISGASNVESYLRKATISQYFGSSCCLLCDEPISSRGLCATCATNRQTTSFSLSSMMRLKEKDYLELVTLCQSCTGATRLKQDCISMDCPVLYRRVKADNHLQILSKLNETLLVL